MQLQQLGFLAVLLISTTTIEALSVESRTFFNCYDSQGWCKSDCSLPCFSVDHCNGSIQAMYTCPSIWLLVLIVAAIVLIILFIVCCISCCCCPCCWCAKCMRNREARKRKEELLETDIRRYERTRNVNDGYGNYPTARIVEVSRAPIKDTERAPSNTSRSKKKNRQKTDIVHMRQREFDDSDIIDGFEQGRAWEPGTGRRGYREPLQVHTLEYEDVYRNGHHHEYPIVPEPDYPTDTSLRQAHLVSVARRHNDNATSLYRVRGTQTSAASLEDRLDGGEAKDDSDLKGLSI